MRTEPELLLPLGVADPLWLHEFALEMGQSIQELTTGRPGMSLHELTILWPRYFAARNTLHKTLADAEGSVSPEEFDREFVGGNSKTFRGGG